jgi:hypothetical protein
MSSTPPGCKEVQQGWVMYEGGKGVDVQRLVSCFRVLGFEFRVWALGCGLWVSSFEFWFLVFGL